MGKLKIPKRWLNFVPVGKPICGTPFIVFKSPLNKHLNAKIPDPSNRFDVATLCQLVPNLGLVIDLTFNERFYDGAEYRQKRIGYLKMSREGIPPPASEEFFIAVDDYITEPSSAGKLIGVHCTSGMKRTCYYVCRYMIQRLGFTPDNAIAEFEDARGHQLQRLDYLNTLLDDLDPIPRTKPLLKLGNDWITAFFGPNRTTTGIPETPPNWREEALRIREENQITNSLEQQNIREVYLVPDEHSHLYNRNLMSPRPRTRSRSPKQEPNPSYRRNDFEFGSERDHDCLRNHGPGQTRGPLDFDRGLHGMRSDDDFDRGQFRSKQMERDSGGSIGMALRTEIDLSNFMRTLSSAPRGMGLSFMERGSGLTERDPSGSMGMGPSGSIAMGPGNFMYVNRGPVGPLVNEFNSSGQQWKADESGRGGLGDMSDYHERDHYSPHREHTFSRGISSDRRQGNRSSSCERRSPGRRIRDNRSSSYERRSPGCRIKDAFEKTRFSRFANRSRSNSRERSRRKFRDRSPWDSRDRSRRDGRDNRSMRDNENRLDGFRHRRSRSPLRTPPPPRISGIGQNSSYRQRLNDVVNEAMQLLVPEVEVNTAMYYN